MIPFSILDLSPILEGADVATSFRNTLDLARHAERLGFRRYWLAEHHGMSGIGSAATAVLVGHVAAGTSTIRVGAGGVMLPNHAPLVVAEQFGTLAALHPGRIDLGVGRAPGSGPAIARALRRGLVASEESFPRDLIELREYFEPPRPGQPVVAVPGAGLRVPIWVLGSSLYGAELAGHLGLPFAFASHFAPALLAPALELYRSTFRPSPSLERPYAIAGANVFAAATDDDARRLFTSLARQFLELRRTGDPGLLSPPIDPADLALSPMEKLMLENALACSFVGSRETVRRGVAEFLDRTRIDELMIASQIFDHGARVRSIEIIAEIRDVLASPP